MAFNIYNPSNGQIGGSASSGNSTSDGFFGKLGSHFGGFLGGGGGMADAFRHGSDMFLGTNFAGTQAEIDMAREAAQFNAKEAQLNRSFQERMSSSAYQRTMDDMKKAGVNPMLAIMKGGASTPGGAQGSMQKTGSLNPAGGARLKNMEVKMMQKNIDNATASAKKLSQDTQTSSAQMQKLQTERQAVEHENERRSQEEKVYKQNPNLRKTQMILDTVGKAASTLMPLGGGLIGGILGGKLKGGSAKKSYKGNSRQFNQSKQRTREAQKSFEAWRQRN